MIEGTWLNVSAEPIEPGDLIAKARSDEHGGLNFFLGSVRTVNGGKEVVAVSYDAFEPLAIRILEEICGEARSRWGAGMKMAVAHRTGRLEPGEVSVGVCVSSRHRDESYQASRYIIEQIKHRAPIWKKEEYSNGETEWLKGHALCQRTGEHSDHAHAHEHAHEQSHDHA